MSYFLVISPASQAGEKNYLMHFVDKTVIFPSQGTWKAPSQLSGAARSQIRTVTH